MSILDQPSDSITSLLEAWARRAGITDGKPSEVTLEIVFDTQTGTVRRAILHRKGGADWLDQMGESAA